MCHNVSQDGKMYHTNIQFDPPVIMNMTTNEMHDVIGYLLVVYLWTVEEEVVPQITTE